MYLTPDGKEPSKASACGKEIRCLSFQNQVHEWLSSCLKFKEIEYAFSVREIIRQLLMTIESFTGQAKGEYDMEIKELIASSPENIRTAFELQSVVRAAVEDKRKEFLKAVDEKLKSQNITYGTFEDAQGKDFNPYVALQYRYDKIPGVVVCLGSDENITYVSYYLTDNEKKTADFADFVRKIKECGEKFNPDNSASFKEHLYYETYDASDKGSPNFWTKDFKIAINEATFELFDPDTFNSFVDVCAERIQVFLEFSPE